jgi:hypothetical protein
MMIKRERAKGEEESDSIRQENERKMASLMKLDAKGKFSFSMIKLLEGDVLQGVFTLTRIRSGWVGWVLCHPKLNLSPRLKVISSKFHPSNLCNCILHFINISFSQQAASARRI